MLAEERFNQRIVGAAENGAMGWRCARLRKQCRDALPNQAIELLAGRAALDRPDERATGLLHHPHPWAALADLLWIGARGNRPRRRKHRYDVGIVFLRI